MDQQPLGDRISGMGTVTLIEDGSEYDSLPIGYNVYHIGKELNTVHGEADKTYGTTHVICSQELNNVDIDSKVAFFNVREVFLDSVEKRLAYLADSHSHIEALTSSKSSRRKSRKLSSSDEEQSKNRTQRTRRNEQESNTEESGRIRRTRRSRRVRQESESSDQRDNSSLGIEGQDSRGVIVRGDIHLERDIKPIINEEEQ